MSYGDTPFIEIDGETKKNKRMEKKKEQTEEWSTDINVSQSIWKVLKFCHASWEGNHMC